jgi:uncharacterized protein YfiM (DUF2279 family)
LVDNVFMKWLVATLVLASWSAQAADKYTLDELRFLSGNWSGRDAGNDVEEQWSDPANGTMMGMYREMSNGKTTFYEFFILFH